MTSRPHLTGDEVFALVGEMVRLAVDRESTDALRAKREHLATCQACDSAVAEAFRRVVSTELVMPDEGDVDPGPSDRTQEAVERMMARLRADVHGGVSARHAR